MAKVFRCVCAVYVSTLVVGKWVRLRYDGVPMRATVLSGNVRKKHLANGYYEGMSVRLENGAELCFEYDGPLPEPLVGDSMTAVYHADVERRMEAMVEKSKNPKTVRISVESVECVEA